MMCLCVSTTKQVAFSVNTPVLEGALSHQPAPLQVANCLRKSLNLVVTVPQESEAGLSPVTPWML